MENAVTFKGFPGGLRLVLDPEPPWEELVEEIREGLASRRSFLANSSVSFEICGRALTPEQKKTVMDMLHGEVDIVSIRFDPQCSHRVSTVQNRIVKGTVRNGQQVESEGDLVVIGDVNPGGQVQAAGNVIVLGALKGVAHAGNTGAAESVVFALEMAPIQVRIAGVIARPGENGTGPALIYLEDSIMTIEPIII